MVTVFVIITGLGMIAQIKDATMTVLDMELVNNFWQSLDFKGFAHVKQDMLEILVFPGRAQMTAQILVYARMEHAHVTWASVGRIALSLLSR
jgi:hypothetical protein